MSFDANYRARNLPQIRPEWLRSHSEEVLDPQQSMIDTHHHLWDIEGSRYLAADLAEDVSGGHNVTATVFVECKAGYFTDGPEELRPVGETRFALVGGIEAREHAGGGARLRWHRWLRRSVAGRFSSWGSGAAHRGR